MSDGNQNSTEEKLLNRRKFVQTAGSSALAVGFTANTTLARQSSGKMITKVTGEERAKLIQKAKRSVEYQTVITHISRQKNATRGEVEVYEIKRDGKFNIVSWSLSTSNKDVDGSVSVLIGQNQTPDAVARFHEFEKGEISEMEQFVVESGEIQQRAATVEVAKSDEGEIESVSLYSSGDGRNEDTVTTQGKLTDVTCTQCKNVYRELCKVGCTLNIGVFCLAFGGIGSLACGYLVNKFCSELVVPNDCTYDAPDVMTPEGACKHVGVC